MIEGGWSSRSSSSSNGSSIFVMIASMKAGWSLPRVSSEGTTLGIERKVMLSGFGSDEMKLNHSSVTTNVTRMFLLLETRSLHRFIMGLMSPLAG
ncbi:UDP-glycosyltransferase 87A1 [Trifolium repens]|nr:UDP-glycosyltransferase 87A1 [Trifolium repens]